MKSELMEKAIELAKKGKGKVKGRPLVGCVIEKNGEVIGTGFHGEKKRKHAEAIALKKAGEKAKEANLYCSLEPCSHRGRTGACTKKIINAGIKRVFIGALDPNPRESDRGIKKLEKAGIKTRTGVLEQKAIELNDYFNKWIQSKKPFVVLKSALTRDGFISWGNGRGKKITCKKADELVQNYRKECDCILVGVGTIKKDNPKLTCRKEACRNPVRVVLDTRLETPLNSRILREKGKTILFHAPRVNPEKRKKLELKGAKCIAVKEKKSKLNLKKVLSHLGKRNYMSVLVEGGQMVNTSFLERNLVDKLVLIFSRKEVGYGLKFCRDSLSKKIRLKKGDIRQLGNNVLIEGYLKPMN